ncbi:MAG: hypothetical protein AAGP08_15830 [Pseudomonadota bacterium]
MLARGEDRHHNFEHVPVPERDFDPAGLDLHETIRQQQAAVMMRGAKANSASGMYD